MKRLIEGLQRFQLEVVGPRREFFNRLGKGQTPSTLFITCADSRIDPNLICQTDPGELFVHRNAGNLVPPFVSPDSGEQASSEQATVEYGVDVLRVRDIVVCGHTHCGAVTAAAMHTPLDGLPGVQSWLQHTHNAVQIVEHDQPELDGTEKVMACVCMNVRVQLGRLGQYPTVQRAIAEGRLRMHGWLYDVATGEAFAYDGASETFKPLLNSE